MLLTINVRGVIIVGVVFLVCKGLGSSSASTGAGNGCSHGARLVASRMKSLRSLVQVEYLGLQVLELLAWECGNQWLQGLAIILGNAVLVGGHRLLGLAVQKSMQG